MPNKFSRLRLEFEPSKNKSLPILVAMKYDKIVPVAFQTTCKWSKS